MIIYSSQPQRDALENHHLHDHSIIIMFLNFKNDVANCGVAARREFILLSHVGATLRKDRGCAHPARLPPHLKSLLLVISLFPSCREAFVPCLFSHSPLNMKILPEKGPEKGG